MSQLLIARLGVLLLIWTAASSLTHASTVTYDNTSTATVGDWTPDGFWPFSYYSPNEPTGDQVGLDGPDRSVTQFDLLLSSTQPATVSSITLSFCLPDGLDGNGTQGAPGTLLWSGTLFNVSVNGLTTLTFPVPSVEVPDEFIWIVSADSEIAGLATFDPPTIGSSGEYYWDWDSHDGQWYALNFPADSDGITPSPVANFGARIWAPEPVTGLSLAFGLPWLLRRKAIVARRKTRRLR